MLAMQIGTYFQRYVGFAGVGNGSPVAIAKAVRTDVNVG